MNLRQRLDELRALAEKASPGILYLRTRDRATVLALLEVVEAQHRALEVAVDYVNEGIASKRSIWAGRSTARNAEWDRHEAEVSAALSLLDKEES